MGGKTSLFLHHLRFMWRSPLGRREVVEMCLVIFPAHAVMMMSAEMGCCFSCWLWSLIKRLWSTWRLWWGLRRIWCERERDCCNSSEWDIETHWAKMLFCQGFYLGMCLKWQPVSQFPLPALSCTGGVCIRPHAGGKARAPVSEHSQDVEINSSSEQKTDKNLNGILFCSICIPYCRRDGTACNLWH